MESQVSLIVKDYVPETYPRRILLCNPPIYDTRFPWSQYQQPISLLQLSTLLKRYECEVCLFDTLYKEPDTSLHRRRIRVLTRDGISLNIWRFGQPTTELTTQLVALQQKGWQPDEVYIECFATFWWEGVAETVTMIRHIFPLTRVILYGAYPMLAPDHAEQHSGADIIVTGHIQGLAGLPLDLSHTPSRPSFSYLSIGTLERSSNDIFEELCTQISPFHQQGRVWQVAFADHDVVRRFPEQFRAVLQACIQHQHKVSFYALGNLYPRDLVEDPKLASLLLQAGFKQLVFADDRYLPFSEDAHLLWLDEYHKAIAHCIAAGYPLQKDALVASVCLGRPGEDLAKAVAFMTKLAHITGSIMVIPYQPIPAECAQTLPLEQQNGKLFPFAKDNQVHFREYQNVLGLAAVLNAKYRSHTFDFSGNGMISRLVRQSLISESWQSSNMPGQNRPVTVGWFNKEGKWVRS